MTEFEHFDIKINNASFYIPFICFYQEKIVFSFNLWDSKVYMGSITHDLSFAFATTDIAIAKRSFNMILRRLAPKKYWNYHGLLKVQCDEYLNVVNDFKRNLKDYINYSDIKSCNLIEILDLSGGINNGY